MVDYIMKKIKNCENDIIIEESQLQMSYRALMVCNTCDSVTKADIYNRRLSVIEGKKEERKRYYKLLNKWVDKENKMLMGV